MKTFKRGVNKFIDFSLKWAVRSLVISMPATLLLAFAGKIFSVTLILLMAKFAAVWTVGVFSLLVSGLLWEMVKKF